MILLTQNVSLSGGAYVPNKGIFVKDPARMFVKVPVYLRDQPLNSYTVIRAQPPSHWVNGMEVSRHCHSLQKYA